MNEMAWEKDLESLDVLVAIFFRVRVGFSLIESRKKRD